MKKYEYRLSRLEKMRKMEMKVENEKKEAEVWWMKVKRDQN